MTNDRLVVDASIVAKAYLKDEAHTAIAQAILADFAFGRVELIAPQFLLYEIPSAIQGAVLRRRLGQEAAQEALARFFELGIPVVGDIRSLPAMIRAAYEMGQQMGCKVYDALYVLAAETLQIPFLTADKRVFDAATKAGKSVVRIDEYDTEVGRQ